MRIIEKTTLSDLEKMDPSTTVVYAVHTCWWCVKDSIPSSYRLPGAGIPCDLRGSVLMEGELGKFLELAKNNKDHYGKHELKTFIASYHGKLLAENNIPTSFESFERYNEILDEEEGRDKKPDA